MVGLVTITGNPAAPPYTNGPYTWDQNITFSGTNTYSGASTFSGNVTISANLTVTGTFTFGDASIDNFIILGRMSTGTAAGTAISIDATTYQYSEGIELRYAVSDWADTYTLTNFRAMYLRCEATESNATGTLMGMELYGVANDVGIQNLKGLLSYAYIKGTTAKTVATAYGVQAELSWDAGASTTTITTEMSQFLGKLTGGVCDDYTKIHGMILRFGDMDGQSRTYGNGILIQDDAGMSGTASLTVGLNITMASTTGISLSGNNATGISITGTYTAATSKAIHSAITINNANLTDGYGTNEFDLTLTGTSAGHVACSSSWININTGTHGASGEYIAAQNNGVYEDAAATITGAKIIFGMRAQVILGDTDAAGVFPFSVNTNNTAITALFDVNNSTDLGLITNAGSDNGTLIPVYKDSNDNIGYVKIYSAA